MLEACNDVNCQQSKKPCFEVQPALIMMLAGAVGFIWVGTKFGRRDMD